MRRVLKKNGRALTTAVQTEVLAWDTADLRGFLQCLSAGARSDTVADDAAEALAYLNWRAVHRRNATDVVDAILGGPRCAADTFEGRY